MHEMNILTAKLKPFRDFNQILENIKCFQPMLYDLFNLRSQLGMKLPFDGHVKLLKTGHI